MLTMFSFDWLRFTSPNRDALDMLLDTFPAVEISSEITSGRGVYTVAQTLVIDGRHAGRVEWNPEHPEWKVSFTFEGLHLHAWRGNVAPGQLIRFVLEWGYTITRIDLAVDVLGPDGDIEDLAAAVEAGDIRTRTKTTGIIRSRSAESDKGLTVYIGSRQSDKFMRVYHKGAQMGTDDKWYRIELELKGGIAKSLAERLVDVPVDGPDDDYFMRYSAKLAKSEIRAFLGADVAWYNEALSDDETPLLTVERKRQKSERWAFTTLIEMVRNATREHPGWGDVAIKTIKNELDGE